MFDGHQSYGAVVKRYYVDEFQQRNYIAEILTSFSLAGLVIISVTVIWLDRSAGHDSATLVFNNVLPLFGTWVGTVLAYYFSRSNFATAAIAYKQLATGDAMLVGTPATAAMIDKGKIIGLVTILSGKSEVDINLKAQFLDALHPPVSRVPVIDSTGAVKYILYENTLNKFVAKQGAPPGPGFNPATATLQSLLDDPELKKFAVTFALIPSSATLADAKKRRWTK